MATIIPHFDLPLRLENGSFVTVEQDTLDDVANCVSAICRFVQGARPEAPKFGIPEQTFLELVDPLSVHAAVITNEPRADITVTRQVIDGLVQELDVSVSVSGGSP